jgi:hypothetical protein
MDQTPTPAPSGDRYGDLFGTPTPHAARKPDPLSYGAPREKPSSYTAYEQPDDSGYVIGSSLDAVTFDTAPSRGGQKVSINHIDDEWLREAIERVELIQQSFPIQAHIEYSQEANLPFTLVVQRATPAMAVRVMVTYIEFLAAIGTPPRGRIQLINVRQLGRTFYRNVLSALEPYFPNSAEVAADEPDMVDIIFHEPHPGWSRYPTLPLQ